MRFFASLTGIIFITCTLHATDYYLSNTGNDNNSGTSKEQAWATIARLNKAIFSLKPGDRVLFERGGRFEGGLNMMNIMGSETDPIIFTAYGSGEDPVIDGTREVTGWTRDGKLWRTTCQDCPLEIHTLYIDGQSQPLGRYPNDHNLTTSGGNGKTTIYDDDLSFEDDFWKGAQVVISTQTWVCDAVRVLSQTGSTITLADRTSYDVSGNKEYFFQNHYNTLDTEGEWAFDSNNKEIYLYSEREIGNSRVSIGSEPECILVRNGRHIRIEHLALTGSRLSAVKIEYSNSVQLSNNTLDQNARMAVHLDHCDQITVDSNNITNTLNIGIGCWDSDHCRFTGNRLENTATIAGRGQNGTAQYSGIIVSRGSDNLIEYNEVFQTGYNAITFYSQANMLIKNNFVNGYCTVITDGGGIYTWHSTSPGNRIIGNIVMNSRDDLGIYIDDESENIEISGNTAALNGAGIYIHNSRYINVLDNLCYNNHGSQLLMARHGNTLLDQIEFRNNQVFTLGKRKQYSMRARFVNGQNIVFENNCFADPFKEGLINSESSVWKTKVYTIPEWQSLGYVTDRGIPSTFEESGLADTTGYVKFFINPSQSVRTVSLEGTYKDLDKQVYVGTVQLAPYTSIVLVAEERDH